MTKHFLKFGFVLLVASCQSEAGKRNELMTKLVIEKQSLQDSASSINAKIKDFTNNGLYDSSLKILDQLEPVQIKLKKVNFSIDSLSKMK